MLNRRTVPDGQAAPSSENHGISAVSSHNAPHSIAHVIILPPLRRSSGNSYTPALETFQAPHVTDHVPRNEDERHNENAKVQTAGAGLPHHSDVASSFPPTNPDYAMPTLRSSHSSSPPAFTSRLPRSPPFSPPLATNCDEDGSEHSMSSNQPVQEPANHIARKGILSVPDGGVTRSYMTETASSTSTTSRTQDVCRGCRKSGNQLLPLIPCSKCRRGFHKGCGNPKPSQRSVNSMMFDFSSDRCHSTNFETFVCGNCLKRDLKAVASENSTIQIPTPRASTEAYQPTTLANAATSSSQTAASSVNKVPPGNGIPTGPRGHLKDAPNGSKDVIPMIQSDRYKRITCPWWQDNDCAFAERHCEFAHTDTGKYAPKLPNFPPIPAKDFTCHLWLDGQCCRDGRDCCYAHNDTGLYFSSNERATRKHVTCYYWHTSHCELAEEACSYAHKETGRIQWQPAEDAQSHPGPYSLQSYACPWLAKHQPCRFQKDGKCPYSHALGGMSSLGVEAISHLNQTLSSTSTSRSPSPGQPSPLLYARSARQIPVNVRLASLPSDGAPRHPPNNRDSLGQEPSSDSPSKPLRSSIQTSNLNANVQIPVKTSPKRHMARRSSPLDPSRRNIAIVVPQQASNTPAAQQVMGSNTENLPPITTLPFLNEQHSPEMLEGFLPLNGAPTPREMILQQALVANKLKRRGSGGSSTVYKRPRLMATPPEHPQVRGDVTGLRLPVHESAVLDERPSLTGMAQLAISDWEQADMTRAHRLDAMVEELLPDTHTPQLASSERLSDCQNSISAISTLTSMTRGDSNPTSDQNELAASETGDTGSIYQPETRPSSSDSSRQSNQGQPLMAVNGETSFQAPTTGSLSTDLVWPTGLSRRCYRCAEQGHHRRCLHGVNGLLEPRKCLKFIRDHRMRYPGRKRLTRQEWDAVVAMAKASFPSDSDIQALDGPEDEAVDIDEAPGPIEGDDLRTSAPSSAQDPMRAESAAPAIQVNETASGALSSLDLNHDPQPVRTAVQPRDRPGADGETAIQKLQARGVQFESDTDGDEDGEVVDDPPPRRIEALWQPRSSKHLFELDRRWDSQFEDRAYASSISRPPKKEIVGNLLKHQCSDRKRKFGNPHQEVRRGVRQVEVRALVQMDRSTDPQEMPQLVEEEKTMTFGEFMGMPKAPVIAPTRHKDELDYMDQQPELDRGTQHGGGIAAHRARRIREDDRFPFVYTSSRS